MRKAAANLPNLYLRSSSLFSNLGGRIKFIRLALGWTLLEGVAVPRQGSVTSWVVCWVVVEGTIFEAVDDDKGGFAGNFQTYSNPMYTTQQVTLPRRSKL